VYLQVACVAEGLGRVALGTSRHDPCGVVDMGDGACSTSFTSPLGSLHCCQARGKAAPTLPVRWDNGFKVDGPLPRSEKNPALACSWWEEVEDHGLFPHEDLEGVPSPSMPRDFSQPSPPPFLRNHLGHT
jgi:hypothetical protein